MYWRIWFELYKNGKKIGAGVWHQYYSYKGNAVRYAKKRFGTERVDRHGDIYTYKWTVSTTNPWRKQEVT